MKSYLKYRDLVFFGPYKLIIQANCYGNTVPSLLADGSDQVIFAEITFDLSIKYY